ncbi:cysteine-rich CWC family protein [Vibrio scophthalmi]|uniref:cysteine-rich CWC family protein n=1 Tax=Vibrio scophthalmi TaxID=45658 RepID=UPI0038733EF9
MCGQPNSCLNLEVKDSTKSCWCNDPSISFPEELLSQIPPEKRRKACVCKQCALKFQARKQGK